MDFTLKNGTVTQIDDEDLDLIKDHCWCSNVQPRVNRTVTYIIARLKINGVKTSMSLQRFIMQHHAGRPLTRKEVVDHINADTLDNRKQNLRIVSHSQNHGNTLRKPGKSLPKGVHKNLSPRARKKYIAIIAGKWIGSFSTVAEAHQAYKDAATARYGDCAKFD